MISILNANIEYLKDKTYRLTTRSGVYLMKDIDGNIIYIGKAKNLKNRVSSYFRESVNHNAKTLKMISKIHDYDFIVTDTEEECLLLECGLIKQYKPKYNILLKDSKGYSYIKVSKESYPRITSENHKDDDGNYIGIYTSSSVAKNTVDEVNSVFKLPTCKKNFPKDFKKQRPCLNYHIGKCMGLCKGEVSQAEYNLIVKQAIDYIKHGSERSIEELTQQMLQASETLDFERAIAIRNRIEYIKRASTVQKVKDVSCDNSDFIGKVSGTECTSISVLKYRLGRLFDKKNYYIQDSSESSILGQSVLEEFLLQYYTAIPKDELPKNVYIDEPLEDVTELSKAIRCKVLYRQRGAIAEYLSMANVNASEYLSIKEGRTSKEVKALEKLSKVLGLAYVPKRIEAYDISNIGNSVMVGSMVVFENGRPNKSMYRKFSIDTIYTQNDYACMENVLTRRLKYLLVSNTLKDESFSQRPDLIFVDGGSIHVQVVKKLITKLCLNIEVFGIVKDDRHNTRAISSYDGKEIHLSKLDEAFKLLVYIQDEMHRVAISYARKKHLKSTISMDLTSVKGIGEKKAILLMSHYKTIDAMKEVTAEELKDVAKLSNDVANALYDYLHSTF